ncbi:ABC transporter ATP-binding protein [Marinivivus vitaminiproducens]|uniref:ABC transporter ATP-binding protein n=1 Tax=Marinivivus vitaminiproducens TaxID=3035935 RepID=UPI0027AB5930|nr:ABC transporter ATP-binding protein [Geminicoccaceae bacterium SCSIO 64248]
MASLVLDQLSKVYTPKGREAVLAVDAVDLDIQDGEIVGFLGSSGCGKTSTLRMIAGFEDVTSGAIRIGDRPVHALAPSRRGVAMAFEGYALYPPLRVRDNIGFALLKDRMPRGDVHKRVAEVASLLEIEPVLDRYPPLISAGQQQRTSLARALVRRADVSLLDEPMSQLEPQLRATLRARIKDYLIAHRMTTVFVTHDQTEAIALADRIAVMEKGVLQQFATPKDLKEKPANLFVASFIGEPPMNIMDVDLGRADGRAHLYVRDREGGVAFTIGTDDAFARSLDGASGLKLGIRPHRIALGDPQGAPGIVTANQWLGDQTHLALDVGGLPVIVVSHDPVPARIGERVTIRFPAEALHVFDAASGNALAHGVPADRALVA